MAKKTHEIPAQQDQGSTHRLRNIWHVIRGIPLAVWSGIVWIYMKIAGKCKHFGIVEWMAAGSLLFILFVLWMRCSPELAESNSFLKFFHDHASDLFMTLLVAFLPYIVLVTGRLGYELANHRTSLKKSSEELYQTRRELKVLTGKVQEDTERLGRLAENMLKMYQLAEESVNQPASAVIHDKSLKWTEKWAELILRSEFKMPHLGASSEQIEKAAIEYATSRCLELMYASYVDREVFSISTEGAPLLTTAYPTYLEFLSNLGTSFIDNIGPIANSEIAGVLEKYKVCIITLADILPIGFLMLFRKTMSEKSKKWEGGIDKQLLVWRDISFQLARASNCLFKRVFITTEDSFKNEDGSKKIFVPEVGEFKSILHDYNIWYPLKNSDLREGFPGELADDIRKALELEETYWLQYKKNTEVFLVSKTKQLQSNIKLEFTLGSKNIHCNKQPISVKSFLIDVVHGGQADSVGWCNINDDFFNHKFTYREGFPTDMFIIGLVPRDKTLNNPDDVDYIKPIMGVACRQYFRFPETVCTIKLYLRKQLFEGAPSVWLWIQRLLKKAVSIP